MCMEPIRLKDRTQVACRTCNLCRRNRLNDLVGRAVAEQSTSSSSLAVTLTYAGDTPASVVLTYRDVQLMLKKLRFDGYKVRYICAGEYGEAKARAHWHIILFFQGKAPEYRLNARVDWPYWPHGFSFFQRPDVKGFAYALKYALKRDPKQGSSKAFSLSKKPPLGYEFFMNLAADLVERHLPVHSPEYAFTHITDYNGRPRRYWLQGRMREMFLDRYCDLWRETHGTEPPASDFLLEKHLDPIARKEMEDDPVSVESRLARKRADGAERARAQRTADFQEEAAKRHEIAILAFGTSGHYLVLYSDETAEIFTEDPKPWLVSRNLAVTVQDQLSRIGLKPSVLLPVCQYLNAKWRLSSPQHPARP